MRTISHNSILNHFEFYTKQLTASTGATVARTVAMKTMKAKERFIIVITEKNSESVRIVEKLHDILFYRIST